MAPRTTFARTRSGDAGSVQVFRELLRTLGLVERVMQPYFARFGITGSQWGVLRNLYRAEHDVPTGLRIGELSERLLIRPPSVSGVVDRLERAGLVSRETDPDDQRAKFVRLTVAGREMVERVLAGHQRQIDAALGGLDRRDQDHLQRLLARLGRHLEEMAAGRFDPPVEDLS